MHCLTVIVQLESKIDIQTYKKNCDSSMFVLDSPQQMLTPQIAISMFLFMENYSFNSISVRTSNHLRLVLPMQIDIQHCTSPALPARN